VAADAYVEFLPDYLIPYRGGRLYQEVELRVEDSATLLLSDALAAGRTGSGEAFAYDLIATKVEARSGIGALRFVDALWLEPGRTRLAAAGMFGGRTCLGTLYVLTRRVVAAELADALSAGLQGMSRVNAGASRLPNDAGVVVRILADGTNSVQAALRRVWQVTREKVLGVDVPSIASIKYGWEPNPEH
jgi:urease accessory protein